ncbi:MULTISPECIES: cytochrome b [Burkholderia]|uniref:Cytochrome b n=1 Tax=Burkholderia anthina TaxID=179879 RepID=A0A6P2GCS3_9BURK|nr:MULTISPECIES: cytochrome b/b6 domain-containing protein [Burkholderia]MBM2771490.1 cytochrome b [Burkholderia anthina]VVU51560.1 cytochrome B561 [Burkholderia anthina]
MNAHSKAARYSRATALLHWIGVVLMMLIVLSAELRHLCVRADLISMRLAMVTHIGSAMAILFLVIPRLIARLMGPRVPPLHAGSPLVRWTAHAVHIGLYVFLVAECLIGWAIVNAKGMRIPMPVLGFEFPALVPEHARLVHWTVTAHMALGYLLYTVLVLHIGAALWHHFVQRDGIMRRMSLSSNP